MLRSSPDRAPADRARRRARSTPRARRTLALLLAPLLAAAAVLIATPAAALAPPVGSPGGTDGNPPGRSTQATIVDMIDVSGLYGGTVPSATAQTPYPSSGLQDQRSVSTAQIVLDDPGTSTQEHILTYCIDLHTETRVGIHYRLGTWSEANVPNLPYVQWILNNYYPNVPSAPGGTAAEKVRAVQGAIWYFTDQFVVSRFYPQERAAVRQIVEAAQAALRSAPPPEEPQPPTLTVAPASIQGSVSGELVGPFLVGGSVDSATVAITGTQLYRDAGGTIPVLDGQSVAPGDRLWARYDAGQAEQSFTLTGYGTVPAGNVYLYDGNNPPLQQAQKLVLATQSRVPVRATASILHPQTATLDVDVVISGEAAGQQDEVQLTVSCDAGLPAPIQYIRYVPAASSAGRYAFTFPDIPADGTTTCTVIQDRDGSSAAVQVAASVIPPQTVLTPGTPQTITVTDEYSRTPGSLQVDIAIDGAAAGLQSQIVLAVQCDTGSGTITGSLTVPAGTPAGTTVAGTLTGLPSGSLCTAGMTDENGDNADAELVRSSVDPIVATVPAGGTALSTVSASYATPSPATGRFAVDLTVAGDAAGLQSAISVSASCDSGVSAPFTLPAGARAGSYRLGTVGSVPVGARCTVAQTADGQNDDARLTSSTITPASVVIADTELSVITVADGYAVPGPPAGAFQVNLTIAGPAAGSQGEIGVEARCGAAPDGIVASFTVPAGAAAGSYVAGTIPEVPVGLECAATLSASGENDEARLSSSTVTPDSVVTENGVVSVSTVANSYVGPGPGPTPTPIPTPSPIPSPSPGALPDTGGAPGQALWVIPAAALLLAGAAGILIDVLRRRRRG